MNRRMAGILTSIAVASTAQAYTYKPGEISSFPEDSPEVQAQIAKCGSRIQVLMSDGKDLCKVGTLEELKKWVTSREAGAIGGLVALGVAGHLLYRRRRDESVHNGLPTDGNSYSPVQDNPSEGEVSRNVPINRLSIEEIFGLIQQIMDQDMSDSQFRSVAGADYISVNIIPNIGKFRARTLVLRFKQLELLINATKQGNQAETQGRNLESAVGTVSRAIGALIIREKSEILTGEDDLKGIRRCMEKIKTNFFSPRACYHFCKFMVVIQNTEAIENRRTRNVTDIRDTVKDQLSRYKQDSNILSDEERELLRVALFGFVNQLRSVTDMQLRSKAKEVLELIGIYYRITRTTNDTEVFEIGEFINILLRLDPAISEDKVIESVTELSHIGNPENSNFMQNITNIQNMFAGQERGGG